MVGGVVGVGVGVVRFRNCANTSHSAVVTEGPHWGKGGDTAHQHTDSPGGTMPLPWHSPPHATNPPPLPARTAEDSWNLPGPHSHHHCPLSVFLKTPFPPHSIPEQSSAFSTNRFPRASRGHLHTLLAGSHVPLLHSTVHTCFSQNWPSQPLSHSHLCVL